MRTAKNKLTIEPLEDGRFRLFGYMDGMKIRRWGKSVAELEEVRRDMQAKSEIIAQKYAGVRTSPTWLTFDQIREAEAAFKTMGGSQRSLLEIVNAGLRVMCDIVPKLATKAQTEWLADLAERERRAATIGNCRNRIAAFFAATGAEFIGDVTTDQIADYVFKAKGVTMTTKANNARVVQAFFNHAVAKGWLKESPFKVDMADMKERAGRSAARPRILTPDQCAALLKAAIAQEGGRFVPYTVLSLFCSMRPSEVQRTLGEHVRLSEVPGKSFVRVWPVKAGTVAYRKVTIPENMVPLLRECADRGLLGAKDPVEFYQKPWDEIREAAGLITRSEANAAGWREIIPAASVWQEDIMRHTGGSYLYQACGDIVKVAKEMGNSVAVAMKHYMDLPEDGDSDRFFAITGALDPVPAADTVAA